MRRVLLLCCVLALAACARVVPPPARAPVPQQPAPAPAPRPVPRPQPVPTPLPPVPPGDTALAVGVRPGPALPLISAAEAHRALEAFRISCPSVMSRADASGLTQREDWRAACASAASAGDAEGFFRREFALVEVGGGAAFATGYYEPEIRGCRARRPDCAVPIYAKPADLLDANPRTGARGRGRVDERGEYVLYYERSQIEDGALAGRGLEIAWAADPIDLFFLQIQGSGRLLLPDGGVMRIGYAGQNGREYVAIGRPLRERGLLQPPITMQGIRQWLVANPEAGRALMRENRSYIFFQELTGAGPLGALGRPVTPRASVAADPNFVPLGAPVLLRQMDNSLANGLWVAQDTGGAIRGANRFDTFWGAGADAASISGAMQARGRAWLLLPRAAVERLRSRLAPAQP